MLVLQSVLFTVIVALSQVQVHAAPFNYQYTVGQPGFNYVQTSPLGYHSRAFYYPAAQNLLVWTPVTLIGPANQNQTQEEQAGEVNQPESEAQPQNNSDNDEGAIPASVTAESGPETKEGKEGVETPAAEVTPGQELSPPPSQQQHVLIPVHLPPGPHYVVPVTFLQPPALIQPPSPSPPGKEGAVLSAEENKATLPEPEKVEGEAENSDDPADTVAVAAETSDPAGDEENLEPNDDAIAAPVAGPVPLEDPSSSAGSDDVEKSQGEPGTNTADVDADAEGKADDDIPEVVPAE